MSDIKRLVERCYAEPSSMSDEDLLRLLSIDCCSDDMYHLISASNRLSREQFKSRGYVFAQIGLNAEPCSGDCKFCSLGSGHFSFEREWHRSVDDIVETVKCVAADGVDDIFLMTTADYDFDEYISVVEAVRPNVSDRVRLAANIGDFDVAKAERLKTAGVTGVYHVNRLREGIDTAIAPQEREATLDAIRAAGLELYYCIEPIGAEHSYEEILTEIRRAERLQPEVMAVMRRVSVESTPMADRSPITALELTNIAAVTNLVVRPRRAMNLHETEQMSLIAGTNQIYAELWANPRDVSNNTEQGRGLSVERARTLLLDSGWL